MKVRKVSILASDGKALVVVMDHARTFGAIEGLGSSIAVIEETAVYVRADAVMMTVGVAKRYQKQLIGRFPTILRLDGGPSTYREDLLAYTEWSLLHSVEEALPIGTYGVVVMAFVGIPVELQPYRITAKLAVECIRVNSPLMVGALPCPSERIPKSKAAEAMASATRFALEHGADVVKSYYTGTQDGFRRVTDNCPVLVMIAAGPMMKTIDEAPRSAHDAVGSGATGVLFGRNIWQSCDTQGVLPALRGIIYDGHPVADALAESEVA